MNSDAKAELEEMADCRSCPKCGSNETRAISEELRRCKVCRHVFRPRFKKYPTFIEIKEAQRTLGEKFK